MTLMSFSFVLSTFFLTLAFPRSLAAQDLCASLFHQTSTSVPPEIRIPQASKQVECYVSGACNLDAGEVLQEMMQRPESFDLKKLKVLILGDVMFGYKAYRIHVAVYDGRGYIYDPTFHASRTVKPIKVSDYIAATLDKHPSRSSQIRLVDPEAYLAELPGDYIWSLYYFGYGMQGMGNLIHEAEFGIDDLHRAQRGLPVGKTALQSLPPILNKSEFISWLSNP